ncbi:uncharacterized protein LOC144102383 [Amblyomma americanum]
MRSSSPAQTSPQATHHDGDDYGSSYNWSGPTETPTSSSNHTQLPDFSEHPETSDQTQCSNLTVEDFLALTVNFAIECGLSWKDEQLYPGSRLTIGESMVLILESLLKLIEAHVPKEAAIPTSKYIFFKQFTNARESATLHFYCPSCLLYLGERQAQELHCSTCGADFVVDTLKKNESYFLTFDIAKQVKDKLSLDELNFKLLPRQLSYDVGELTTSQGYHNLPMSTHDLSVTWNTDGVPLYESSGYSIWPLLLQINELPQKVRTKHMLLAGLWFGTTKPKMCSFLKPFVKQMNILSSSGFQCTNLKGNTLKVRIFPGPCCVDTVARAMVMNMNQFNGSYGCAWCMHEGQVVRKGSGHVRVYPVLSCRPAPRTHKTFLRNAAKAEATQQAKCGVKGSNVLFHLAFFSFPAGFVVDYMHAVCAGFVRHTACMWFDTSMLFPYSLGGKIDEIDQQLCVLKPIWEISRLPRSLKVRKYWKASEWRNWLLFYSPVVLNNILPRVYYKNWLKLVKVMHFLLADTVAVEKLKEAGRTMYVFVREYQDLYGIAHMTYNTHLLLHLVASVEVWGPLWNYSAYAFEGMNGQLVQLVNGTRYAGWQVVEKFYFLSNLPIIWDKCSHFEDAHSKHLLMKYFLRGYNLRKNSQSTCGVVFFGKGETCNRGISYKKVLIGSFLYCTKGLDKSRRLNSFVCINGIFGQIENILAICVEGHRSCACVRRVVFHLRKLHVVRKFVADNLSGAIIHEVCMTSEEVEMVCENPRKCMLLQSSSKTFVCCVASKYIFEAT